jgi:peptidoglycan hydrolase CwlO-like protein
MSASEATDECNTNKIQEIEEKISGIENTIEDTDTLVKDNTKHYKVLTQNIQKIHDTVKRLNLRLVGTEEGKKIPSTKD